MRAGGTGRATAVAYPNIALVKYWGKRDEELVLPVTGSLSMTLDIFPTTTRVAVCPDAAGDSVTVNERPVDGVTGERVRRFLELVRNLTGRRERAVVTSANRVPTGAGLASSAAGFAALAAAAAAAYGLPADGRALSRLARRGSGSACRSVFGGFVQWHAGRGRGRTGDLSSYAEPVVTAGTFDPVLVVAIVDTGPKKVASREAMRQTMRSSPLYRAWARTSGTDLDRMRDGLAQGDLATIGEIAEHNALGMHAAMLAARPAIRYLSAASLAVLDQVAGLRTDGVPAFATFDAGPNAAVLCRREDARQVANALTDIGDVQAVHLAGTGPGIAVGGGGQ